MATARAKNTKKRVAKRDARKAAKRPTTKAVAGTGRRKAASAKIATSLILQSRMTVVYESGYSIFGQLVNSATNRGLPAQRVAYSFGSKLLGGVTTSSSGIASLLFQTAPTWKPGTYTLNGAFAGDAQHASCTKAVTFVIFKGLVNLYVPRVTGKPNSKVVLSATATSRITGKSLSGLVVEFYVGTYWAGRATTGATGVANLSFYLNFNVERPLKAQFDGNATYDKTVTSSSVKPLP